jgi:hypothetical protein
LNEIMKKANIILIALLAISLGCVQEYERTIKVGINNNIEVAAILYLISDIGLNAHQGSLSYEAKQHFDHYSDHEVIGFLNEFIDQDGLWAPIHLFLQIDKFPDAALSSAKYAEMDFKAKYTLINQFIESANDFFRKADVTKFLEEHIDYYTKCIYEVRKNIPDENFIPTMEHYYGISFSSYNFIPSPAIYPGIGVAYSIENNNSIDIYYIGGSIEDVDSTQQYQFSFDSPSDIREMSVHEFGHSFVNPITNDIENKSLIEKFNYLFEPIKDAMRNQAYPDWHTCVNEHIVRLGEIRIALAMNDTISANKLREQYIEQRKFIYLSVLENKITEYENNRDRYHSFAEFFPELIESLSEIDFKDI